MYLGSYTCDVLWYAAKGEEKQCFSFEFAAAAQMNLWASKLNEARAKFETTYQADSYLPTRPKRPVTIFKDPTDIHGKGRVS